MRRRDGPGLSLPAVVITAVVLALASLLASPSVPGGSGDAARAADPSPTPAIAGDPRSSGEGAGLVGSPLLAIGGALAIGILAAGATLIYVRVTRGSHPD